jgi:hypothetical protein
VDQELAEADQAKASAQYLMIAFYPKSLHRRSSNYVEFVPNDQKLKIKLMDDLELKS